MLKKILAVLALLYAAASFAAVDVNKATAADLDGIKGIGPVMSKRIIDERKKGDFRNWDDLMARVKGIGSPTAAKYSAGGLTVNGSDYKNPALARNDDKKAAKADNKEEKKEAQAEKKEEKAVAKAEKKDAAAAKPAASAKK